jgi:hypothetical protein
MVFSVFRMNILKTSANQPYHCFIIQKCQHISAYFYKASKDLEDSVLFYDCKNEIALKINRYIYIKGCLNTQGPAGKCNVFTIILIYKPSGYLAGPGINIINFT